MNNIKFPNMYSINGEYNCILMISNGIMNKMKRDDLKGMILSKINNMERLANNIKSYYQDTVDINEMYDIYKLNENDIDFLYDSYKKAVEQLIETISEVIKLDK